MIIIKIICNIIMAISSLLSTVVAICALKIAKGQLNKIIENQKVEALKIVLEIEAEMNHRKTEFDEASRKILEVYKSQDSNREKKRKIDILGTHFNTTKENYFNIVDRFCYCVEKKYLDDLSWRAEYRNYIKQIVDAYPEDFNSASSYRHIKNINDEWQSQ